MPIKPAKKTANFSSEKTIQKQDTTANDALKQTQTVIDNSKPPQKSPKQANHNIGKYLPGIIFALIIAISIIAGAYFFAKTKISSTMLSSINFFPLLKAITTFDFVLFIVCASFAIAFLLLLGKRAVFKYAVTFSFAGYLAGIIISLALFPIFDFFTGLIAGAVAIPIGIHYLNQREEEVKYLKEIRSGVSGTGRIITIICVVFFIFLLITSFTQKEKLQNGFTDEFLKMTIGNDVTLGDSFTNQLSDAISAQQVQTIDQIINFPEIKNLQEKKDPDGVKLAQELALMKQTVDGNAYKQQIATSLKNQNLDIGRELLNKFPLIKSMEEYSWLLGPISALFMLLFIGGLIVKNIAAVIYWAIAKHL